MSSHKMRKERKQYIDGVNNLDYWMGTKSESARNSFIYYHESGIRAVRYKQWKLHFETSENYYAPYEKQKFPVIFNRGMDPYESFNGVTDPIRYFAEKAVAQRAGSGAAQRAHPIAG